MSQELEGTLTNTANLVGTFGSEGGGGTSNYNDLINKPSINSVTLQGNKTASQLGFANVATSGSYNDLTGTPTIPAAQVNSDWNASSGVAEILNKPTIPAAQVNSDWNATSGVAKILNKPTIPAAQVNSDWNATSGVAQILNKPTVYQNAAELPVSSSDPTDTKTYIDNISHYVSGTLPADLSSKAVNSDVTIFEVLKSSVDLTNCYVKNVFSDWTDQKRTITNYFTAYAIVSDATKWYVVGLALQSAFVTTYNSKPMFIEFGVYT